MTPALLLALILVAGSTQNDFHAGLSWPDISIADIIAMLPDIISRLPEIVAELIPNLPNLIANLPDLIAQLPSLIERLPEIIAALREVDWAEVVASLPGNLPDIVGSIVEYIRNLEVDWAALLAALRDIDFSGIVDRLPEIIANLPDIIANLPEIVGNLPAIIDRLPEILANLGIDWESIRDLLPISPQENDPGSEADIQQYPSIVQMECAISSVWVQCCVGSVLNSGYILTAGHCVGGRIYQAANRRIRAGTGTRGRDGAVMPISYSVVHPSFGSNGRDSNIAVVRLQGNFIYGPNIQRIGIVSQGTVLPPGLALTHAGWGSTAHGRFISDRQLRHIGFVVVSQDTCREQFSRSIIPRTITDTMFCAGRPQTGGRKADVRDAGAPVYYGNALVGVQSFGRYTGNGTWPVVYTSVGSFSDWIVSTAT